MELSDRSSRIVVEPDLVSIIPPVTPSGGRKVLSLFHILGDTRVAFDGSRNGGTCLAH